jgi:hypothetical protein
MRQFLTVDDLAALFSKHRNTIYRWIEEGLFPHAFQVKDGWYVPTTDVKQIVRAGRVNRVPRPSSPPRR